MTRCGIALLLAALLLQSPAARTAPLDKDGCARLKTEQGQLEHAGTRGHMGKGPQWAKTNLEPDKLEQIRRLLEVDEQLLFRCHGKPLVNLPKDAEADPAAKEPGAKAAKAPKVPKKETVKKAAAPPTDQPAKTEPAAKKALPTPKAPADKPAANADGKGGQKAAAAKKAKAKPKADDAYRAPTVEPGGDQFGRQPAPK